MDENSNKAYVEPADALLSNPHAAAGGIGSPLFVINLCASMAPAQVVGKTLPGLDEYRLYQVSRVEDGRTRYRLRLGFFTSQGSAENVLATVREKYPTAFTACLSDDDRKFTRGYVPSAAPVARPRPVAVAQSTPAPVAKQAPTPAPARPVQQTAARSDASKPASSPPSAPKAAAPAAPVRKPAPAPASKRADPAESAVIEMTWEPEARPGAKATPPSSSATASSKALKALDESDITEIEISWGEAPQTAATAAAPAAAKRTAPAPTVNNAASKPVPASKPASPMHSAAKAPIQAKVAPEIKKPLAAPDKSPTSIELQLEIEPAAAAPKRAPTPPRHIQPFHVGKGVNIPDVAFSLQQDSAPAVKSAAPAAPALTSKAGPHAPRTTEVGAKASIRQGSAASQTGALPPADAAARSTSATGSHARIAPGQLQPRTGAASNLDSTQTIRALTNAELSEDSAEKWFAIQLAVSEQPMNMDAMPHLDIFEAYRLYSIASAESGKIAHSLRLGFFREAVSAEAVSGYLKTFFASPSVLRISTAEQLRFKDAPSLIPPPAAPKNEQKVVDLSHARERAARPSIPIVTMEVVPPKAAVVDRSPTGAYKLKAPVSPDPGATAKYKTLTPTLKPAAPAKPAAKRSKQGSVSSSGRYRTLPRKSLQDQLLDEAREVELTESGIRRLPKNDSLLSRLVDRLKK